MMHAPRIRWWSFSLFIFLIFPSHFWPCFLLKTCTLKIHRWACSMLLMRCSKDWCIIFFRSILFIFSFPKCVPLEGKNPTLSMDLPQSVFLNLPPSLSLKSTSSCFFPTHSMIFLCVSHHQGALSMNFLDFPSLSFFFFFFFTMEMWALKISQWVPPNLSSSFFLPSIYKPFSMLTMCAAIGAIFWGGCWMLSMKKLTCSWEKKKKNLREMVDGAKFGNKFQQMKIPTGSH